VYDEQSILRSAPEPSDQAAVDGLVAEAVAAHDEPIDGAHALVEAVVLLAVDATLIVEHLVEGAGEKLRTGVGREVELLPVRAFQVVNVAHKTPDRRLATTRTILDPLPALVEVALRRNLRAYERGSFA
jgi:hypothetical protein